MYFIGTKQVWEALRLFHSSSQLKVGGTHPSEFSNIKYGIFLRESSILLYANGSCNLFEMFWYATNYDVSGMFYEMKEMYMWHMKWIYNMKNF